MKSGINAKSMVIPGENAADLEDLLEEYYDRYRPVDPVERQFTDLLILNEWRLRRFVRAGVLRFVPAIQRSSKSALRELERMQKERRAAQTAGWDRWESPSSLVH